MISIMFVLVAVLIHLFFLNQINFFSFWMALGDPENPTLILGQCSTPKSLLHVEDEKRR